MQNTVHQQGKEAQVRVRQQETRHMPPNGCDTLHHMYCIGMIRYITCTSIVPTLVSKELENWVRREPLTEEINTMLNNFPWVLATKHTHVPMVFVCSPV